MNKIERIIDLLKSYSDTFDSPEEMEEFLYSSSFLIKLGDSVSEKDVMALLFHFIKS